MVSLVALRQVALTEMLGLFSAHRHIVKFTSQVWMPGIKGAAGHSTTSNPIAYNILSMAVQGHIHTQVLLVGCHDALRMYRVRIDDACEASQKLLTAAIERVAAGEGSIESISFGSDAAPPDESAHLHQDQPLENGHAHEGEEDTHLSLQLLAQVSGA